MNFFKKNRTEKKSNPYHFLGRLTVINMFVQATRNYCFRLNCLISYPYLQNKINIWLINQSDNFQKLGHIYISNIILSSLT